MSTELDELVAMASGSDQQILKDLLARNPNLSTQLDTSSAVFKAFVDGDDTQVDAALKAARTKEAANAAAVARKSGQTASSAASVNLDELAQLVDQSAEKKFRAMTTSDEYVKQEDERIKKIVKSVTDELAPQLLGTAARTSDEIYQVRRSHEEEFGTKLNTDEFTKFINDNANKFANLSAAHDAFVAKERVDKQIATGVAEGLKAARDKEATESIPGNTLATGNSVLSKMVQANKLTVGETARGPALDAAARAFRSLQTQHVE